MDAAEVPVEVRRGAAVAASARAGCGRSSSSRSAAILVVAAVWFVDQPAGGSNVRPGDVAGRRRRRASGDAPPDFSATAIDGSAVSMAALAGQPIWLTFGASWCPDCRAEATDLQATYAKYQPQGLAVLGVFIDEPETAVADYAKRVGFTFPLRGRPRRARSPTSIEPTASRSTSSSGATGRSATCGSAG